MFLAKTLIETVSTKTSNITNNKQHVPIQWLLSNKHLLTVQMCLCEPGD